MPWGRAVIQFLGIALVLLVLSCGQVLANQDLAAFFDPPCDRYEVPKLLALAIAGHESGMRPWALNIAGRSVFPESREQALAICQAALAAGVSFDLGLMQVNSWWIRRYQLPLEVLLDPPGNVQVGVWILGQEIKRHGLNWMAVASYHTPLERNPERALSYAKAIFDRLQGAAPPAKAPSGSLVAPNSGHRGARYAPLQVQHYAQQ
ncbi:MAG: lytic transglycosylase domain-containing protein [Desulfovibrionaceae bacterium]|nr:lytic transglycosylase domain-containing protein [Desulfovibrionaceae bacterium]MBF0515104.1 lytic transglycosylase domain-containing protein [Desulfovibrionaceae bacterium]